VRRSAPCWRGRRRRQGECAVVKARAPAVASGVIGTALMMRRSGAPPRYPIGQQVVRVKTGSDSRCRAGAPLVTTRRSATRQEVVSCSVYVVIVSPSISSPRRRKWRSRCADTTEFPVTPGETDPGRWPGPPLSAASVTPSRTISSRAIFGMTRRATGVPIAGSSGSAAPVGVARPRATAARAILASHSDLARSWASHPRA
jgi:hypothetical protein